MPKRRFNFVFAAYVWISLLLLGAVFPVELGAKTILNLQYSGSYASRVIYVLSLLVVFVRPRAFADYWRSIQPVAQIAIATFLTICVLGLFLSVNRPDLFEDATRPLRYLIFLVVMPFAIREGELAPRPIIYITTLCILLNLIQLELIKPLADALSVAIKQHPRLAFDGLKSSTLTAFHLLALIQLVLFLFYLEQNKTRLLTLVSIFALATGVYAMYLTGSRGPILALLAICALYYILYFGPSSKRSGWSGLMLGIVFVHVLVLGIAVASGARHGLETLFSRPASYGVATGRLAIYETAIEDLSRSWGTLVLGNRDSQVRSLSHNWVIGLALQDGIPAMIALVAVVMSAIMSLVRRGINGAGLAPLALAVNLVIVLLAQMLDNSLYLNNGVLAAFFYITIGLAGVRSEMLEPRAARMQTL